VYWSGEYKNKRVVVRGYGDRLRRANMEPTLRDVAPLIAAPAAAGEPSPLDTFMTGDPPAKRARSGV